MPASGSSRKVRLHRERLRKQGLRPIQIWVPDLRSPELQAEARRQARSIAQSESAAEEQAFIDSISIFEEEFGEE